MKKAFVIGHPIAHSRSPLIHNYWIAELGLDASYEAIDVAPDGLADFLVRIKEQGFVGGNVTIPHKENAFALASKTADIAQTLGAANTLYLEDNAWSATNTDGYGFLANLDAEASGWDKVAKTALIIGAGGASRAIIYSFLARGFDTIHILNRTLSRAQNLAQQFGDKIKPGPLDTFEALLPSADIVVNTSSLGMQGQPPLALNLDNLAKATTVTDIVYTPLETDLLANARARGNACVDGLGMLLHQAVPGFEKWFGQRPTVTPALRAHILDHLNAADK